MKKKIVVGLGCLVAPAIPLGVLFFPLGFFILQRNAGTFDKPRFEAVVEEVRQRGLKPGESIELRLDDIHDPKSLRVRKANEVFDRGQGVGNVWATVTADGKLKGPPRFGKGRHDPCAKKLCTPAAKTWEMIRWADGIAAFEVVPDLVKSEWGIDLGGK